MKLILILVAMFAVRVFAEEHGGHELHEIPWKTLGVQTFNFIILVGGLIYLLRDAVRGHFSERLKTYSDLVQRAENAKAEAEKSHKEIELRLRHLESSAEKSVDQAAVEAAEVKRKVIADAQVVAKRIQEDAQRSIQIEAEKARVALRRDLLNKALESTQDYFKKNLGTNEQKRLQNEFVEKIQVVRG